MATIYTRERFMTEADKLIALYKQQTELYKRHVVTGHPIRLDRLEIEIKDLDGQIERQRAVFQIAQQEFIDDIARDRAELERWMAEDGIDRGEGSPL